MEFRYLAEFHLNSWGRKLYFKSDKAFSKKNNRDYNLCFTILLFIGNILNAEATGENNNLFQI
jgi:hypothetical protein